MIVLIVVGDTLGRLFIDREFHGSELFLGTLAGTLMVVLGIEGLSRLPGVPKGGSK